MTNPWPNASYATQHKENVAPTIKSAELATGLRKHGFWIICYGLILSSFAIPSLPRDVKHLVDDAARQFELVYQLGGLLISCKALLLALGFGFQILNFPAACADAVNSHLRGAFPNTRSKVRLSICAALAALAISMTFMDTQGLSSTFNVAARTVVFVKFAAALYIFAFAAALAFFCFRESRRVTAQAVT